jgi:hypothetical protein
VPLGERRRLAPRHAAGGQLLDVVLVRPRQWVQGDDDGAGGRRAVRVARDVPRRIEAAERRSRRSRGPPGPPRSSST